MRKKVLILLLSIMLLVCIAFSLLLPNFLRQQRHIASLAVGDYNKIYTPQVFLVPSLDSASTIHAQKLLENPLPVPEFLAWIRPAPGNALTEMETICFRISKGLFKKGDGFWTFSEMNHSVDYDTQIIVNDVSVPNDSLSIVALDSLDVRTGHATIDSTFCFSPKFDAHTNFVKFKLSVPSPNHTDIYSYEWAYRR